MLDDAAAKARRLVADLERDAAGLASTRASDENATSDNLEEGQRVIAAALVAARRLLNELQGAAENVDSANTRAE